MRTLIRGATCLTPHDELPDSIVVFEDDTIIAVEPSGIAPRTDDRVIDAPDAWLVPGLIDVHTHGGGGHDVMEATPHAVTGFARFLVTHGVTAFLPTTISAPSDRIMAVLAAVASTPVTPDGAHHLGVHLEGPYLAGDHRGAQPLAQLRPPAPDEYRGWFDTGVVRLITLAPELDGALALIEDATAHGVQIAIGHTGAGLEQVRAAADHGATQATHTFNGMRGLHHRDPGTVGGVLTDPRIFAQVIVDGIHVHPAVVDLLVGAKGPERAILVSDSIAATGLPDGDYDLGATRIHVRDGVSRTAEGGLAGSTLTLDAAVRNLHRFTGLALGPCVTMATATPATAMGWDHDRGHVRVGYRADLAILDADLEVLGTVVGGRLVHHHPDLEIRP